MILSFLISLLLGINTIEDHPLFIVNSKYTGDNIWITEYIAGYIGRYHEYPASGRDIMAYTCEGIKSYDDDYVKAMRLNSKDYQRSLEKILLNKKNYYGEALCIIPYRKEQYVVSGRLTDWQSNLYEWVLSYYKPAFYDPDGNYLFRESEILADDFSKRIAAFVMQFPYHFRFKTTVFGNSVDVPLRIRVKYLRNGPVMLAERIVLPSSSYIRGLDERGGSIDISLLSIDIAIGLFEPFFLEYLDQHPAINVIDCLIPVCIPFVPALEADQILEKH